MASLVMLFAMHASLSAMQLRWIFDLKLEEVAIKWTKTRRTREERTLADWVCALQSCLRYRYASTLDTYGPDGCQLVLPACGDGKEKRLVWVHTLCAAIIYSDSQYCRVCPRLFQQWQLSIYEDESRKESSDNEEDTTSEIQATCYYAMASKDNG